MTHDLHVPPGEGADPVRTAPARRRGWRPGWGRAATSLALVGLLVAGGCSSGEGPAGGSEDGDSSEATERPARYVALGDSFTAAPLVPDALDAKGCYRSTANYPALVAAAVGAAEKVDVSCSGADTTHMTRPQTTVTGQEVPPQFEVLNPRTDLVTVGIGGNDFNVFGTLTGTCPQLAERDPDGAPCRDELQEDGRDVLLSAVERTQERVRKVVEGVRERSPEARILLVNYPQVSPEQGACPALQLARGDLAYARQVAEALDAALRDAAAASDVELVDLWTASEGHDVCSDQPWVNGPVTDVARALQFHPFSEGQQAAADLVLETLRS